MVWKSLDWKQEVLAIHTLAIKKSGIRPFSTEDVRFLALALCGEVGEFANLVKKEWRGDMVEGMSAKMRAELADIAVYHFLLCTALGINVELAIQEKLPEIRMKFPP
jgi:NTP pyrophosphatase (non-canonical NTP hydrolase)